jgi:Dicarboxylate transport
MLSVRGRSRYLSIAPLLRGASKIIGHIGEVLLVSNAVPEGAYLMTFALNKRRIFLFLVCMGFLALGVGLLARLTLTEMAVGSLLKMAGASEVEFNVARASPWTVVLEDIGFHLKAQKFAAKRISMERLHWWMPSLGSVRIEQARLPLTIDGSDVDSRVLSDYQNNSAAGTPSSVPVEEVHVDGLLIIRAADQLDQALTIRLEAHLTAKNTWKGKVELTGPGIGAKGEVGYTLATDQLDFDFPALTLDLKPWQGFVQRTIVMPGGGTWGMEGRFTGNAEGHLVGRTLTAAGSIRLREGHVRYEEKDITAEEVEADLEFIDFAKMLTKPGSVRVRELRVGTFPLRELSAELSFAGGEKIVFSALSLKALGGHASTEPFKYFSNLREVEAVVLVDDISIEEIMGLTKDLPAKASGRVNGRFPIRIDESGVRMGSGWLELKPGVYAELQLQASGLLTGNVPEKSPGYQVLKKVEDGLLKLKIDELRLEIRPPNAPPGRSAQLRISGSPVDPNVKAPVTLDLNVNGPLEKLLNLGFDSRVHF